jgi:hypothetical protein
MPALPPDTRLRIGVSGHRSPPKLPTQSVAPLRAVLDRIFAMIPAAGSDDTAGRPENFARAFLVISSLAEGSDRMVAEAGLKVGFGLQAVLPFASDEYAHDFATPESRATFTRLLACASAIVELPGAAEDRPRAYEAAGLFMLAHTDVLVAIWDGEPAAGVGGTAEIVDRAIADGILVVWIDPQEPQAIRLSLNGDNFRAADLATLAQSVKQILTPPIR